MPDHGVLPVSGRSARSRSRSTEPADASDAASAKLLASYVPLCDGIARLLWPRAEVVLHDLARDLIVHIANPLSGRRAGDRSMAGDAAPDALAEGVIGPYEKRNFDGRRLKAVMCAIRNSDSQVVGVVCVNLDVEALSAAVEHIQQLAAIVAPTLRPPSLFGVDWREEVNTTVGEFLVGHTTTIEQLSHEDSLALLADLDSRGVFALRTAAPYVASLLKVSRATLYTRLAAIRRKPRLPDALQS